MWLVFKQFASEKHTQSLTNTHKEEVPDHHFFLLLSRHKHKAAAAMRKALAVVLLGLLVCGAVMVSVLSCITNRN